MTRRSHPTRVWLLRTALAFFCVGALVLAAEAPVEDKADAPKPQRAGPPDPPPEFRAAEPGSIEGPSVIPGKPAGIAVGQYAPDFELQPIESYPDLAVDGAPPPSVDEKIRLSQLVGKQPVLLLYGSYT